MSELNLLFLSRSSNESTLMANLKSEFFELSLGTVVFEMNPHTPSALRLSRSSPARVHLLPAHAVQLLPELLCSVPTQVHTSLEERWFSRYGYPRVDKDLRVSDPALLVPVEPLGFLGRRILDEAL